MKTVVVIPNWNGAKFLRECIDSVLAGSHKTTVVVVDNGSKDESRDILSTYGGKIHTIYHSQNLGFTGGVNAGINYALDGDFDAVALLNNDAHVDKDWLKNLVGAMKGNVGITTSLILSHDGRTIDTTGDTLTTWGLPYPRGRGKKYSKTYKNNEFVFGASGGASLYSLKMFREIGLFDQDFFAYYEDVDVSWRAQLAGWKVMFIPSAKAYHRIGATSSRIKGFTTYHTFKNLRLLLAKNTSPSLRRIIYPRFYLAYSFFQLKALFSPNVVSMLRGSFDGILLTPKKFRERKLILANQKVTDAYILGMLTHDLPENSRKLRDIRSIWWKIRGKK